MNAFEFGFLNELDKLASFGSNGRRDISAEIAQYLLNKEAALSWKQKLMIPVLGAASIFGGKAAYDKASEPDLNARAASKYPMLMENSPGWDKRIGPTRGGQREQGDPGYRYSGTLNRTFRFDRAGNKIPNPINMPEDARFESAMAHDRGPGRPKNWMDANVRDKYMVERSTGRILPRRLTEEEDRSRYFGGTDLKNDQMQQTGAARGVWKPHQPRPDGLQDLIDQIRGQ